MRPIRLLLVALAMTGCERAEPPGSVIPDAPVPVEPAASLEAPTVEPVASGHVSSSPLALATIDGRAVAMIADEDERRLVVVDVTSGTELFAAKVPGVPAHVIVDARGVAWTTLRDASTVIGLRVACTPGRTPCEPALVEHDRHATPREPIALGLADGDATLLVSCGWARTLAGVAIAEGGRELSVALAREPRGFAIDRTGARAYVAHAVGSRTSVVDLASAIVVHERELHWRDDVGTRSWTLTNVPRLAVQGMAIAAMDDRVLAPMVLAYPGEPETDAAGYGMSVEGMDPYFPHEPVVIDLDPTDSRVRLRLRHHVVSADKARISERRRDYARERPPCLLPRAVAVDDARARLLIACQDLGQVVAIDVAQRPLERTEIGRWQLGAGTNAIAIDRDGIAWAWSPFDRRLDRLADDGTVARTITLAATHEPLAAAGRRAFHTPRAFDGRSCASCHIDGRDDGLAWQSPRGIVQTPVLAGRAEGTAPFGWHAGEDTITGHMRRTFKRLRADPPDDATLDALAQYIAAMPDFRGAPPALSPAAERGRDLFVSSTAGCAACHDDGGTDGLSHRISGRRPIDTPSLRFVGDTAPYMHDGRYATLREVITHTDGAMGSTTTLDDGQIADLIAYLRVL